MGQIKKRDGNILEFDKAKITNAIYRAAREGGNESKQECDGIADKVVEKVQDEMPHGSIPTVEGIQDMVEQVLIETGHAKTAKSYIIYRQKRAELRTEKRLVLEKDELDEVDKKFDLNALRILKARYLRKDDNGRLTETPKQLFTRVAVHTGLAEIFYDETVFDEDAGQDSHDKEDFEPAMYEGEISIGKYVLNKYHLEAVKRMYDRFDRQQQMKVSWSALLEMLKDGAFGAHEKTIDDFYSVMVNRQFMPNTPAIANFGSVLGMGSACFHPDQLVLTKDGPEKISEIKVGDEVLTHKGRFRKVKEVFMRETNSLLSFGCKKLPKPSMLLTDEHPILAVKNGEVNWYPAYTVRRGDHVALSYPTETQDLYKIKVSDIVQNVTVNGEQCSYEYSGGKFNAFVHTTKAVKNEIEVDYDLMKVFGFYLSEGSISENDCVRFTLAPDEMDYCKEIVSIIEKKFGVTARIETNKDPERKWLSLRFHSTILAKLFENIFGTGFNKKKIPGWIMSLPVEKQKGLMSGMIRGDGTVFKNWNKMNARLVMCNNNLVYSFWQMCMRCGVFAALGKETMSKLGTVQPLRCTLGTAKGQLLMNELFGRTIQETVTEEKTLVINGIVFTEIESIEKVDYNGPVFNLEVEEDHSYVANMVSVHNCFVLGVEDDITSIMDTLKHTALIHQAGGGCIAGDARVWTTLCGIEPIEVLFNRATIDDREGVRQENGTAYDVRDLDILTLAMNPVTSETGLRKVTHVWKFDVPAENQIIVRTREGAEIQTSDWHPFMVLQNAGLEKRHANQLQPDDIILGPDRAETFWPWKEERVVCGLQVNTELAWLIGFTLGDGSFGYVPALRQHRLRWFSGTTDVLDNVRNILKKYNINVSTQRDPRGKCLVVATLAQNFVYAMQQACALERGGPKDTIIHVPEHIGKSPLTVVRAFIAGLIDSDGNIDVDGSPSYTTASEEMAHDLAALVSLLGYRSTIRRKEPQGKGKLPTYTVLLCPLPQVNDFAHEIIPYMANEQRKQRLQSGSTRQTALAVNFEAWRDVLKRHNLIGKKGAMGPCATELNYWSAHGGIDRLSIERIAAVLEQHDKPHALLLRRIAQSGHQVSAIARAEQPKPYYDLTVDEWNTYAAGKGSMIMIHNTGFNFSKLRPEGDIVKSTCGAASGPISFMTLYDNMTDVIKQGGMRRGANMGILNSNHPDIEKFITAKDGNKALRNFNISVLIMGDFWDYYEKDEPYPLVNPRNGQIVRTVSPRMLFDKIVYQAWESAEPGVIFFDKVNEFNPFLDHLGPIVTTNPCVAADTKILTENGWIAIEELADMENVPRLLVDARTLAYVSGERQMQAGLLAVKAKKIWKTGEKETLVLTTESGKKLTATPDHRILTLNGWKAVSETIQGEKLLVQNGSGEAAEEKIISIIKGKITAVYDITEPQTHSFIANGIIVHNCGEVLLYPNEPCNLGSINVWAFSKEDENGSVFVDWEDMSRVIKIVTKFLDNVIDVNKWPLQQIEDMALATRKIGVGIMGVGDLLFEMGFPYDKDEGRVFMEELMEFVNYWTKVESVELAKLRGPLPFFDKSFYPQGRMPFSGSAKKDKWHFNWDEVSEQVKMHGIRNGYTTIIAPTGSISMIAGCSSGIEPVYSLVFEKNVKVGSFFYIDPVFEKVMKREGLYDEELMKEIAENSGSIQNIPYMPQKLKDTFVTAMDATPESHIRALAAFQRWVDSSISKTNNFPASATVEDMRKSYLLAYQLGCKDVTVFRDSSIKDQVLVAPKKDKAVEVKKEKYVAVKTAEEIPTSSGLVLKQQNGHQQQTQKMTDESKGRHDYKECPSCSSVALAFKEGCITCESCGWGLCS